MSTVLVIPQRNTTQEPLHKSRRIYKTGSLKFRAGVWHVRYYDAAGLRHSESTGTDNEAKATRFLQKRLGQVVTGETPEHRTTIGKLARNYFDHLEIDKGSVDASLPAPLQAWRRACKAKGFSLTKSRWTNHLENHFAGVRCVRKEMLDRYISVRRSEQAQNGTIMRELALLRRILNYGDVRNAPKFPRLAESAPRDGFIEDTEFQSLYNSIKDAGLRAMVRLLYLYGFRESELQNLLVGQVKGRELNLYHGTTKNGRPRKTFLDADSFSEIEPFLKGKRPDDFVFTWQSGNRRGQQIRDFRTAWDNACKAAKVPNLMPHDLRRSSVRNMVRSGVPEIVAMRISGHQTRAVFDRYNIVSDGDLESASERIGSKLGAK
jgi:integrase